MAEAAYILCFLTSALVTILLLRAYWRTRARLLLWSCLGFSGLCLNNAVLICDMIIFPNIYLYDTRNIPALLGMVIMVAGLILDGE